MSDLVALKPGTILADDYRIERTLGAGGFGITYLAEELPLARLVTIKEYFPVDFAARDQAEDVVPRSRDSEGDYSWGLDRFLAEAQTLAKFTHPNIVRVYRYFLARNTGYIVLHYEEGSSFKGWLKSLGRAPRQPELDRVLEPLLDALETVHAADYLHRDIAPDNIMIRRDGSPVLIDFGSARGDIAKHSKTISALVKPGYSPYEQYATTSRQQGPWTDIYSLGATLYEAITGRRPPDAPSRMVADELIPPADAALSSYRPHFLAAIGKALRLEIGERPRSVAEWRAELLAPPPKRAAPPPEAAAQPSLEARLAEVASAGGAPGTDAPKGAGAPAKPPEAPPRPAPGPGLAAAFLDGWRKANPGPPKAPAPQPAVPAPEQAATPALPVPVAPPPPPPEEARRHAEDGGKRRGWLGFPRRRAGPPPIPAEPGARKATPRAIRRSTGSRWRAVAFKAVLALGLAATAVALQDQIPAVRREGSGLLSSQTGGELKQTLLKGHRAAVSGVAFTEDGERVVSASADGTLRVWDAPRTTLVRTIELDSGPASALAIAKGRAATGHTDGTVTVWSLENGAKLASFRRSEASIWAVAFAGRPDRVAAAAHDWAVAVWDMGQPMKPVQLFEGHESAARALAFAGRGPFLASGSADQTVKLWSLEKGELVRTYRGHEDFVAALAFEPQGRTLASASLDGQIRLWSTYANRMKRRLKGHEGGVAALAFSPDGEHLVSAGSDGTLRIWNAGRGKTVRTMKGGIGAINAVGISPDGRRIAAAGADGTVRLFDASWPKEGT